MQEIWRAVKNYEGLYEVSNYGRVRSIARKHTKGGMLKPLLYPKNEYFKVKLTKNGKGKRKAIHRLVGEAFVPNPLHKPQINHKNGNKQDNYYENLEWVTCQENIEHAYRTKLRKVREVAQILNDKIIAIFDNCYYAGKQTNICYTSIYWCLRGRQKFAGGYEWYYVDSPKVVRLLSLQV